LSWGVFAFLIEWAKVAIIVKFHLEIKTSILALGWSGNFKKIWLFLGNQICGII
jgi:hypothetical protein